MKKKIVFLLFSFLVLFTLSISSVSVYAIPIYGDYDYEEYINRDDLPESFPYYQEEWSELGVCYKFLASTIRSEGVFKYCFMDEFGNQCTLTIACNGKLDVSGSEYVAPEEDLRRNSMVRSLCTVGGLKYIYDGYGDLSFISWEDDLYRYDLNPGESELNEGFVGDLLSLETAEEAGERLISIFNGDLRIQNTVRTAILVGGGIAVVGSLAAVLLLRKKKKTE